MSRVLRSDGEPATKAFRHAIKDARSAKTNFGTSPPRDPQANGVAERAVKEVMSQMRRLKLGLEARLKTTISSDHVLVDWIAQHGGFLITKFLKGSQNGFTALYRMYGKDYRGDLVEFGECVWAKPKRTGRKALRYQEDPMGPRGVHGVWLGIQEETGENLVALLGPKAPVIRVRAIAHKPEDERWSKEDALGIEAEPRCPHSRMPDNSTVLTHGQSRTMTVDDDPELEAEDEQRPQEAPSGSRPGADLDEKQF